MSSKLKESSLLPDQDFRGLRSVQGRVLSFFVPKFWSSQLRESLSLPHPRLVSSGSRFKERESKVFQVPSYRKEALASSLSSCSFRVPSLESQRVRFSSIIKGEFVSFPIPKFRVLNFRHPRVQMEGVVQVFEIKVTVQAMSKKKKMTKCFKSLKIQLRNSS